MLYIFIADNISILMYIMCVILCLFSALSRRVGALQMSIILYIYICIYINMQSVKCKWLYNTEQPQKM